MTLDDLFQSELHRRGLAFSIEADTGRYVMESGGSRLLISIENLRKDFERDGDTGRVMRFVDAVLASRAPQQERYTPEQLYWCLEPNDYSEPADYRVPVSECVDRVLVVLSNDGRLVTWLTPEMLKSVGLSEAQASTKAFENLALALEKTAIEVQDVAGVKVVFLSTAVPFKASLMLAPNLRKRLEPVIGWPVTAVTPDRDFIYIWASRDSEFVNRVGNVVVKEYRESSYPISTEVYEIGDKGLRATGEFPKGA